MKHIKRIMIFTAIIAIAAIGVKTYFEKNPAIGIEKSISARNDKNLHLTAHRGLSGLAPENTLAAIEEAGKAGYYAAEFDIEITADGKWVLMHDDTVDRTTNGTGKVSEMALSRLREFKIDFGNGLTEYPDEKIPTLEEALAVCRKYSICPMIEVKGGDAEDMANLIDIIKNSGVYGNAMIIDFNQDRIDAARNCDSEIELWYLVGKISDENIALAKKMNYALAFNYAYTSNYFHTRDAKKQGIKLAAWTVDFLPAVDFLTTIDVDYITTNRILPLNAD